METIVIDTSAVIAAILDEPEKARLVAMTQGTHLLAPGSLRWELGNALSAMFKKDNISLEDALATLAIFDAIPIQFVEVDMSRAIDIAHALGIYAYDAYMIACAIDHRAPLLTLDQALGQQAETYGVSVLEI